MKKHGLLKNVFTVGAFTALSRLLGLVREMLQSRLIGAGVEQSAFVMAFALPNMMRKLFGEGALTAAFVPVFKAECEKESIAKAARLARAVMTVMLLLLFAMVALGIGSLEAVRHFVIVSGSASERLRLIFEMVEIMLPYMIFICGAAFGMGVVNSLGYFKASSFMPCLLNLFWIGSLAALSFMPGYSVAMRVRLVAAAILAAGLVQMLFMFWRMKKAGINPLPSFHGWRDDNTRLVWRNLGIATLGAGAIQLNYMCDQILAQLANSWAAGVIGYAERLMDLPLGIVGVAFGTVLLPTLSGHFAKNDFEGAQETLASSIKTLMFILIPSAGGIMILSREITSLIYEGNQFDSMAVIRVSRALAVYAVGLGCYGLQKTMIPWFQAQKDMKTPLKVTLRTVLLNFILNVIAVFSLPEEWRHVGLSASTVICSLAGCFMLLRMARLANRDFRLAGLPAFVMKTIAATVVMSVAIWFLLPLLRSRLSFCNPVISSLMQLMAAIVCGLCIYLASAFAFGIRRIVPRHR